mmetsp:Transcript_2472/g.6170  ORF Transcript_2472/g.6170 Transcript_2472/m.6170 type:complete len:251 (+) Transcript_2472:48-800(+)
MLPCGLGSSCLVRRCLLRSKPAAQLGWMRLPPYSEPTFKLSIWQVGKRTMADEAGDIRVLTVTSEVNVGKLAGATVKTIEAQGQVELAARGPKAVHNAVKTLALSSKYLQQNGTKEVVAASVKKVVSKHEQDGEERTSISYNFLAKPVDPPAQEKEVNFSVAKDTNTGAMAGELAKALQNRGSVTLGGMGPSATNNAVKAIIIADAYMADHFDKGDALTIVPWQDKVEAQGVGESWRILMHCEPRLKWTA